MHDIVELEGNFGHFDLPYLKNEIEIVVFGEDVAGAHFNQHSDTTFTCSPDHSPCVCHEMMHKLEINYPILVFAWRWPIDHTS